MNIAIDISRALEEEKTGIHNYQYYLFKYLLEIYSENVFLPLFYSSSSNTDVKNFMEHDILLLQNKFLYRNLFMKNLVDRFFLRRRILDNSIDLIHATAYTTIAGLENRTVLTIHDLIFIRDMDSYNNFFAKMFRDTVKKVKVIIAISETTKKEVLEECPGLPEDKIKVIFQGINDEIIRIIDPIKLANFKEELFGKRDVKYMLFLGSFTKRKNVSNIIRAYQYLLKAKNISHKLVLVGKALDTYFEISSYADNAELKDKIIIKKYLPGHYIPYLLSAADLFIFPSSYEGFGLPVLEAMKCGCPCITSNVSSLRELFFDSAFMVDPNNVKELAEAMDLLLSNPSLRETYRGLGLKKASLFSWRKTAEDTLRVYEVIGGALEGI